eukprot:391188-Hanusia_phi.AAC.1
MPSVRTESGKLNQSACDKRHPWSSKSCALPRYRDSMSKAAGCFRAWQEAHWQEAHHGGA